MESLQSTAQEITQNAVVQKVINDKKTHKTKKGPFKTILTNHKSLRWLDVSRWKI